MKELFSGIMVNRERSLCFLLTLWALYLPVENALIGQIATSSVLHCSTACGQTGLCTGVSFDQGTGACALLDSTEGLPIWAMTRQNMGESHFTFLSVPAMYNSSCNENTGCFPTDTNLVCNNGKCKCQDFFNRVPDTGFCTATCEEYGNTFEDYPGIFVAQNNMQGIPGQVDLVTCKQHCVSNSLCRSIDWNPSTKKCYLAAVTLLQLPQKLRHHEYGYYSQRNCD